MKREIIIEIKNDLNHYALIKHKNNRENEADYGILIDKDQYEQLRQHFVSELLPDNNQIEAEAIRYVIEKFGHRDEDTEFGFEAGVNWMKERVIK